MTAAATVLDLASRRDELGPEDRARFDRLFRVTASRARLVLPEGMRVWVRHAFGADPTVEEQTVVRVLNTVTGEESVFNSLRAVRPVDVHAASFAEDTDLAEMIDTPGADPFCHPLEQTPEDVFGRVRGRHCVTASNIAKIDTFHGVVIFDEHNPLRFTRDRLADYLRTGVAWGERARATDPAAVYWLLWWNALWKSGASVVHGHAQVVCARGQHYTRLERLRAATESYRARHARSYFDDLVAVHDALGLSLHHGSAVALPSLTPLKEHEVWIVDTDLTEDLLDLLDHVLSRLVDEVGVQSFNLAYLRPPLGSTPEDWSGFPHVIRIVDRGSLTTPMTDIGGLEMFATASVANDPFRLIRTLEAEL